jgi:hypothetical protein
MQVLQNTLPSAARGSHHPGGGLCEPRWAQQSSGQDGSQFRFLFLAAAMGPGQLLECLHESVIDTPHQQVSRSVTPALIAMLSALGCLVRPAGDRAPGSC